MKLLSRHLPKDRRGAFTLIEIVIAMTILSMLTGTIFAVMYAAADGAAQLREADARDEEVSRFVALLRESLESMPGGGKVEIAPPTDAESGNFEMTFSDTPTAFLFGENPAVGGETILGLVPQTQPAQGDLADKGPLYSVAISRPEFQPGTAQDGTVTGDTPAMSQTEDSFLLADANGRFWLPLLENVTNLSWRYWDADNRIWIEEREDSSVLPQLMELSLSDPWRKIPFRMVYQLPDHLTKAASTTTPAASTTDGSTTTPSTPANGAGGAGRPGGGPGGDGQRPPGGLRGDGKGKGEGRGRPDGGGQGGPGGPDGAPRGGPGGRFGPGGGPSGGGSGGGAGSSGGGGAGGGGAASGGGGGNAR